MKKGFSKGVNLKKKEVKEKMKIGLKLLVLIALVVPILFVSAKSSEAYPMALDAYNGVFFNNAEVLLDTNQDGNVSVGDIFWGTVQVNGIKGPTDLTGQTGPTIWSIGGGLNPPAEITGYFATVVTAVYLPGSPAPPNNLISAGSGTIATIILGPVADPNGILAAGEVMRLYESNTVNYNDSTQALAISTATDGTLHSSLGLDAGYWYTLAPVVPPGAGDVGESYAGLNYIISPFDTLQINDPNEDYSSNAGVVGGVSVDLFFNSELGSLGKFGGPDQDTLMHFFSNDPAVQFPVPEPSTMLLLGTGLIGIAAFGRKRLLKK